MDRAADLDAALSELQFTLGPGKPYRKHGYQQELGGPRYRRMT